MKPATSPRLRTAFIGLGQRGQATLRRFTLLDGVEVATLCDIAVDNLTQAAAIIPEGSPVPRLTTDWTEVCQAPDIGLVVIATDWSTHAEIACRAMSGGKDVAVEVPAVTSVREGYRLVDTARHTGRRCFMLENCCFDPFALRTLRMADAGVFGNIVHCQGAYIHDLRSLYAAKPWYRDASMANGANPYPTHGLGPVCQLLGVNHGGDRLETLVSMSATAGRPDGITPVNTTLIHTAMGRTILLQHDVSTPQPYSRLQTVCGTNGYITKYPVAMFCGNDGSPVTGTDLDTLMDHYRSDLEVAYEADARRLNVANRMNYYMDRHLIDSLLNKTAPLITVADAALWSSIAELTSRSASLGGAPVAIPDFTRV